MQLYRSGIHRQCRQGSIADIRRQIGDVRCPPKSRHPIHAFMSTRPSCALSRGAERPATSQYPARASLRMCDFPPNPTTVKNRSLLGVGETAEKVVFRNARRAIILTMPGAFYVNLFRQPPPVRRCGEMRGMRNEGRPDTALPSLLQPFTVP